MKNTNSGQLIVILLSLMQSKALAVIVYLKGFLSDDTIHLFNEKTYTVITAYYILFTFLSN